MDTSKKISIAVVGATAAGTVAGVVATARAAQRRRQVHRAHPVAVTVPKTIRVVREALGGPVVPARACGRPVHVRVLDGHRVRWEVDGRLLELRFDEAPGNRGTEIRVRAGEHPGDHEAAIATVRRLAQVLTLGRPVSDVTTPAGRSEAQQRRTEHADRMAFQGGRP